MSNPLAMIVEDDPTLIDIFAMALQSAGYSVEKYNDGESALRRLRQVAPYMLVLDLHLPHISGEEIVDVIQATPRLSDVIVIITSADTVLTSFLRDRVELVLEKPVSFYQLRELTVRYHPDRASTGE